MKNLTSFLVLFVAMVAIFTISCNGQPKDDYEIYGDEVVGATKYHFFLEKVSANPSELADSADYLSPNVTHLKVGESNTPVFTVNLNNDGAEYKVAIVAENLAGFYGGLSTGTGSVGIVPGMSGNVGFRKKQ